MTPARLALALVALTLIWGTQYLVAQRALAELPPLWLGALRFGVVAVVAHGVALAVRPATVGHRALRAVYGLSHALSMGLLYWAQTRIPSGTTAVLVATGPMLLAVVAPFALPGEAWSVRLLLGCGLGAVGAAALASAAAGPAEALGVAAIMACNVAGVVTRLAAARLVALASPVILLRDLGLWVAATLGALALATEPMAPLRASASTWVSVAYLGVVASALATALYLVVQRHVSATRLGYQQYGSAVGAAVAGMALAGEPGAWPQWLGIALIIAGGVLVARR